MVDGRFHPRRTARRPCAPAEQRPARSAMRGRPPQELAPHVELAHNLLDHKKTVRLYREYNKRNITKPWLNLTAASETPFYRHK